MQTAVVDALKQSLVIEGGFRLSGCVRAAGNKNAALPILAASLLTDEPVTLENVPRINDVDTMLALLRHTGAEADWTGTNEVRVHAAEIATTELDEDLCREIRASILLAGPLLARCGRASVPPPGGDVIGRRRIDTHMHAFEALGVEYTVGRRFELSAPALRGTSLFLDEASVTATENAIMAASLASGETLIGNAACEPHVQDLCRFLVILGAEIEGIGSNLLRIEGVERLGLHVRVDGSSVHVPPDQELVIHDDLGGQIPKIEDGPWPAFPADLTSIAVTVATQARGTILIFEKMFESRLFFVDKLVSMGARIILCDPHRVVVTGPATLYGERLESPDIRAGMAMVIAALSAEGTSTIGNIRQIDRGYERIDERLRGIGAAIERVEL